MSWWDKLLGRAARDPASKSPFPACIDLVPGKLSARVYLHEIDAAGDSVPCWSYVTDGLAALGQKEIVFTLRHGRDEAVDGFPQDPFHLFTTLYQLAGQGQLVDVGGFTQFGARAFFGHHLAYLDPQPLTGVTLPQTAIAAFLVSLDELRALQEFGPTRLISRLGQASRHYPFPPWSDRLRRGLTFERTLQESVLTKVRRGRATGVQASQDGKRIMLTGTRPARGDWQQAVQQAEPTMPIALLTDLDSRADGCLVWEPGQSGPAAITPPGSKGSRVAGCFVLFIPEQTADGGQILEDGFAVTLTTPSWAAVRRALVESQTLSIPATGDGLSLCVEWHDAVYVNPVDQKTYVAPGGWETYQPGSRPVADQKGKKVRTEQIRLLTAQDDIATRTTVEDLVAFCKEVERRAELSLSKSEREFKVLIQFQCTPAGHKFQMAHQGDASQELLQGLHDSLVKMPKLSVRQADVTFQVEVTVSP